MGENFGVMAPLSLMSGSRVLDWNHKKIGKHNQIYCFGMNKFSISKVKGKPQSQRIGCC